MRLSRIKATANYYSQMQLTYDTLNCTTTLQKTFECLININKDLTS